jgi:hypothetical protein
MRDVKLPLTDEFLVDLVLQRTSGFLKLGGAAALSRWFAAGDRRGILEMLQKPGVIQMYIDLTLSEIEAEVVQLVSKLPDGSLRRVLSIGPGNGLVELALARLGKTSDLLLVDIESTAHHRHGFNAEGSGYASLEATKKFISENLTNPILISTCNPMHVTKIPAFDYTLCISLLSMGFHYPCVQYANYLIENSAVGSVLAIDKRRDVVDVGFDFIAKNFQSIHVFPAQKSERVLLRRV